MGAGDTGTTRTTASSGFPTTGDELTLEVLSEYLCAADLLSSGCVVDARHAIIGTGKMGDNVRIELTYEGAPDRAPPTLVAKLPAADERARAMAGTGGAYYSEVMFYRDLAPATSMRTPVIHASEISDDKTTFFLLMEDLSPAEPGSQLVGESREHAALALREAARLASAYYGDPSLGDRDYVMSTARDDGGKLGAALVQQNWPGFLDRFGAALPADCIAFGERYVEHHAHFVTRYQGPKTLIHGDFRSENVLFHQDEATTVDWQTTSESSALADAAYFLGGSVEIDDRRDWERGLIELYRAELDAGGVELGARECWDQYREYAMHGLMITVLGASYSTPDPRSERMFQVMIQRHLQHCVDLRAGEFLP